MHRSTMSEKMKRKFGSCTGCSSCMKRCPVHAVSMSKNPEGFWEAYVDEELCIDCGLCKEVCHLEVDRCKPKDTETVYYAAFSRDLDSVRQSSSGGIFYELCKKNLGDSGVVYGAVQKSVFQVVHQRGASLEDIELFRRSKYLESSMENCYEEARQDLEEGRKVLFSGVGCQIAGLYSYLQKEYENLFTCEVVCHGIPSYLAYEKYLAEKGARFKSPVCGINFRDKSLGWRDNAICEYFEDGRKDISYSNTHPLHSLYLKGINMKEHCASCRYATLPRIADVTLADFWQYDGGLWEKNSNKGISLIAVNSEKGSQLLKGIEASIYLEKAEQKTALESCRHMSHSPILHESQPVFMKLVQEMGFHFAAKICTDFEAVIDEARLYKMQEVNLEKILSVFWMDEQEVIYVADDNHRPQGIITWGRFLRSYLKNEEWINYDFQKAVLSENCAEEMQKIFTANPVIHRIPVMSPDGVLLFEVRNQKGTNIYLKSMLGYMRPFLRLYCRGTEVYFIKRPDLRSDYGYTEDEKERIDKEMSFPKLSEEIEKNEAVLKTLLKDKFSYRYVQELRKIPQITVRNGRYQHIDFKSEYINVVNGCRKTSCQPKEYEYTIHMYGRCGVFGYAVEDEDTLPSALQHLFTRTGQNVRVVNHGLWGADNEKIMRNLWVDIGEDVIAKNDKVVLYMDYLPYMDELLNLNLYIKDSTQPFYEFMKDKSVFYDRPGHMTAEGYKFMAEWMYPFVTRKDSLCIDEEKKKDFERFLSCVEQLEDKYGEEQDDSYEAELVNYLSKIERDFFNERRMRASADICADKETGAIVMNCNPFTKGHRYLIETSAKEVETLMVFVLEEDKSYFSFQDRFWMVKEGTKDLENVYVFPSGRFMISSMTFPEYFIKEQAQEIKINPAADVEIFAGKIAPRFHISVRFAGTEPRDKVTDQYNDALREILPRYGIEFREIKRLEQKGQAVTATAVRRMLKQGDFEGLRALVPESTYGCLKRRGFIC